MSTRKPSNIAKFNDATDKLVTLLKKRYPVEAQKFQFYEHQLELGRRINPRKVVEEFMKFLAPYIPQIMTQDQLFFLEMDLSCYKDLQEHDLAMFDLLKHIWTTSDDQGLKDKVWKIFQLMLMYGVKVSRDPIQLSMINHYRTTPLSLD